MKRETLLNGLTACALGFLIAFGGAGCLVSAFDLQIGSMTELALGIGGICLISGLLFLWKYGGVAAAALLALAAGWLWRDGRAAAQLFLLIHQLSEIYDRAYGWGVFPLPPELTEVTSVLLPVGIYSAAAALSTVWTVCRRGHSFGCLLTALLPLASCIVVTDTVPAEKYLLMVMAGVILLVLTAAVRRESCLQGLRLTAAAAVPVILALLGLFLAVPQDRYVNHSEELRDRILSASRNIPASVESALSQIRSDLSTGVSRQVDLSSVGPRERFTYPVLDVVSEESGLLYLRGQDFDVYDGRQWTSTEQRKESFPVPEGESRNISIHTRSRRAMVYLPAYPQPPVTLEGGLLPNEDDQTDYSLSCVSLPGDWRFTAYGSGGKEGSADQRYLALPEYTRQQAETLLRGLFSPDASNTEKADTIAALVTDSAVYDLEAGVMPEGQKDFAIWFLTEGERGYCVHFATAATVLLRSAGVPARYVTGYTAQVTAGKTLTVTEESAHAWAEYFEPNLGCWIPLEATPAALASLPQPTGEPGPQSTEPSPTQPETEPETQPQTEGTEPPTEETLPPQSSAGEETTPAEPEARKQPGGNALWWILALLLPAVPVLILQRKLRLRLRRARWNRGSANQQALARWREAERLSLLLKESPPEELIALAQKAKFSQYEITGEELTAFDTHIRSCCRRLKKGPALRRLICKYIHAAF